MTATSQTSIAREELSHHFQHWRNLTLAESDALRFGAWTKLAQLQAAKLPLRDLILAATSALRAERVLSGDDGSDPVAQEFRAIVEEMIQLERKNLDCLDAWCEGVQTQRQQLESAAQTLRQIRKAYAHPRDSVWHSYS